MTLLLNRRVARIVAAIISAILIAASSSARAGVRCHHHAVEFRKPPNPIAVNNNPAPSTGAGTASSIGMNIYPTPNVGVTTDDVLQGTSGDTGANGVANLTQIWRVRAQAGANGAANGWSSLAPIGTQGAVFAASTVGFSNINVSFDWYATTQGEANLQLEYTNDGTTWHNVPINIGANADSGFGCFDQHHFA